jgi:hypothetical protein
MPQGFDKTKPEYQAGLSSEMLRTQFNSVCSHHEGSTEPLDLQRGMIWLDRSIPANWKLKLKTDTGWTILFENVTTIPTAPGGTTQFEFIQATPINPWTITHNLGRRILNVIVVDDLFHNIDPSAYQVSYIDTNQLTITFVTGPTSGKAYLS